MKNQAPKYCNQLLFIASQLITFKWLYKCLTKKEEEVVIQVKGRPKMQI